jgi:hypothetical protein
MKRKLPFWLFVAAVTSAPPAFAAGAASDDDVTIMVVDESATPDDVVKVIELPAQTSANANAKGGYGETANNASDKSESGRDLGQQISEDARANANDQARSDAAQQARNDARNDNAGGTNRHGSPH